MIVKLDSI